MDDVFVSVFSQCPRGGIRLHDGCAAVYVPDRGILSIAEERLSRRKHDDGYARSIQRLLLDIPSSAKLHLAFSSALDELWTPQEAAEQFERETGRSPSTVTVYDHHLAHAASALATSPVVNGVAIVVDARGNWETQGFQCETAIPIHSGHLVSNERKRLTDIPIDQGWGQLWRAVTKAIGFPSYHDASKSMALAGIARSRNLKPFWEPKDHDIAYAIAARVSIEDPVSSMLAALTHVVGVHAKPITNWWNAEDGRKFPTGVQAEDNLRLALSVQLAYESWLLDTVRTMSSEPEAASTILLSGGVAANCVAAGKLAELGYDVRVGAAPGDDGQALGTLALLLRQFDISVAPSTAFLAPDPPWKEDFNEFSIVDGSRLRQLLLEDKPVVAFRGASELGPRALGHRSLLAAPTQTAMTYLREVKRREDFQPFGVVVAKNWADARSITPSPYMSLTSSHLQFPNDARHVDDSVRYQTVDAHSDPELHELLLWSEKIWGAPLLVNTSLNGRGEPLISSVKDLARSSIAPLVRDVWVQED
jgi:carbamoyltransferase